MNKNVLIAALSILCILLTLYSFALKAEADKQTMLANEFQQQAIQNELELEKALKQSEAQLTIAQKIFIDAQAAAEAERKMHRK